MYVCIIEYKKNQFSFKTSFNIELEFLFWAKSAKVGKTTSFSKMGVWRVLEELVLALLSVDILRTFIRGGGVGFGCDSFSKNRTKASDSDCCEMLEFEATICGCRIEFNQEPPPALLTFNLSLSCWVKSKTVEIIFKICLWSMFRFLFELIKPMIKFLMRDLSTVAFVLLERTLKFSSDFDSWLWSFVTEKRIIYCYYWYF